MLQHGKTVLRENNNFPHLSDNQRVTIKNEKKQINMLPSWLDHLISNVLLVWGRRSLPCDEHTPCLGTQCEWVEGAVKTPPRSQALCFLLLCRVGDKLVQTWVSKNQGKQQYISERPSIYFSVGGGEGIQCFWMLWDAQPELCSVHPDSKKLIPTPFPLRSAANTQGWNFPSLG